MKVRILLDLPKTIDGKPLGPFTEGQELEMDDAQAVMFIASAMAEEVLPPVEAVEDASIEIVIEDEPAEFGAPVFDYAADDDQ